MSKLTLEQLSNYRKQIYKKLDRLKHAATRCLFSDPLIKATPNKVFRKCGKKNCKCTDPQHRHGPYYVLTVFEDGKQKQYSLKKEDKELLKMAEHYQYQMDQLKLVKTITNEIIELAEEIINRRTEEFKKNEA